MKNYILAALAWGIAKLGFTEVTLLTTSQEVIGITFKKLGAPEADDHTHLSKK